MRACSSDFTSRFILVSLLPHPCRGIKPLLTVGVTLAWRAKQKIKIQVTRVKLREARCQLVAAISHRVFPRPLIKTRIIKVHYSNYLSLF